MSRQRSKNSKSCMICEEEYNGSPYTIIHKTRRQVHSLCISCTESCFADFTKQTINNLKNNLSEDFIVKCPGRLGSELRNQCKQKINFCKINIPQEAKSIFEAQSIFRLYLENNNIYFCPNVACLYVVEVDSHYTNRIECASCKLSWCKSCNASPYHDNITCHAHKLIEESEKKEYVKMYTDGSTKFCPKCNTTTQRFLDEKGRNIGCNHITCAKCRQEWCWLCNEKIKGYDHFNSDNGSRCKNKLYLGTDSLD